MMLLPKCTAAALLCAPFAAYAGTGVINGNSDNLSIAEHWSDYQTGSTCQYDTFPFGTWIAQFDGGGCTQIPALLPKRLRLSPAVSTSSSETHAALVASSLVQGNQNVGADIYLSVTYKTTAQLRQNDPPHAWEVGWITWNGKYDTGCSCYTFNYVTLKSTGWELGEVVNNGGSAAQVFLATGGGTYPINTSYTVEVYHSNSTHNGPGDEIDVYVNGTSTITYTGANGTAFRSGWAVGLYTEDATVDFSNITATRL